MPDRVLVTGGAGFIGLRVARALLGRGDDVVLVDDFSRGRRDAELSAVIDEVELIEHDLTRPLPTDRLRASFDAVYHFAAVVGVRAADERPHDVMRVNLGAALNVLEWAATAAPGRLFLSSTSEVTDGAVRAGLAQPPVGEDVPAVVADPSAPRASYAISKLAGEALFHNFGRALGVPVRIARYFSVYGPRMGHDHVIPQVIDRILDRRDPLPIYGARQTRAFCYIDDAVEATLRLMALPDPGPVVAMVGNDREEIVIEDLVRILFAAAGYDAALEIHDPPPGSPERRLPDVRRLRELTGFEPRVALDEGVRRTFEWYRADREAGLHGIGA